MMAHILVPGLLVYQIVILALPGTVAKALFLPGVLLWAWIARINPVRILRKISGLLVLLLATLAIRYTVDPSVTTLLQWGSYAYRVVLSVVAPVAIILRFGMLPVQHSLYSSARILPRGVRRPFRDVLTSTMYMIPALLALMHAVSDAQRIRYRNARRWFQKPLSELSRIVVTNVSQIPQQRGEAMVIRGIVSRED